MGGIYTLEQIMNTGTKYHWPVIQSLCAYVRQSAPVSASDPLRPARAVRGDVQAALTVLGRRNREYEREASGATLTEFFRRIVVDKNFIAALGGHMCDPLMDLEEANLSYANLTGTSFSSANFSGSRMRFCRLILADLGHADFSHTDLAGTTLAINVMTGAKFDGAFMPLAVILGDISTASLDGADITFALFPQKAEYPAAFKKAKGWRYASYAPETAVALGLGRGDLDSAMNRWRADVMPGTGSCRIGQNARAHEGVALGRARRYPGTGLW
jgi:hypothetical protein